MLNVEYAEPIDLQELNDLAEQYLHAGDWLQKPVSVKSRFFLDLMHCGTMIATELQAQFGRRISDGPKESREIQILCCERINELEQDCAANDVQMPDLQERNDAYAMLVQYVCRLRQKHAE